MVCALICQMEEMYAAEMTTSMPLLAASLKVLNDESNSGVVQPSEVLDAKHKLTHGEAKRWELIAQKYIRGDSDSLADFARALCQDMALFKKVRGDSLSALTTFAHGGCDSPLCAQLHFLYEFLMKWVPSCFGKATPGVWKLNKERGYTT